jgi:hypothetical protein
VHQSIQQCLPAPERPLAIIELPGSLSGDRFTERLQKVVETIILANEEWSKSRIAL